MILERDIPHIVDAAAARLYAAFDEPAREVLIRTVHDALQIIDQGLGLEQILAGIYACELHERALASEADIERTTASSIRSRETDRWVIEKQTRLIKGLTTLVLDASGMPKVVRCNMITTYVLIGYAVRVNSAAIAA